MEEQDLNRLLPDRIRHKALASGTELAIPYPEVLEVIDIATQNSIAVLGVELFATEGGGLRVEDYSGYEIPVPTHGNWLTFVRMNNDLARQFVQERPHGDGHGYILTATSQREFGNSSQWS